ncbi:MAG: hypothetical protein K6F00_01300, partial [Lachnospiraceae bacterium]|nr:hypothetical protein [Lachnospiraceae bacterium]
GSGDDVHRIRKYNTNISGIPQGATVKGVFQFKGPFRHAGCKHVDDSDGISYNGAMDTVTFYIHNFNPGNNYTVHVCCDNENAPDALDLLSCSMIPM